MNPLRKLAGQTAVYGTSTILGRLLNYLLVPIHTRIFNPAEFGVVTEMYAYVTFLIIVFTYGIETAFFRYVTTEEDKDKVFSTSLLSVVFSSFLFVALLGFFSPNIASYIQHPSRYILWFAWILALDAIASIPFTRLRSENKPGRFAFIKLSGIFVNVGTNIFFLLICPFLLKKNVSGITSIYDPSIGVGYVFIANLASSILTLLLLSPQFIRTKFHFDLLLWKKMLRYALPLLVAGLAGMINETLDRVIMKFLLPDEQTAMHQLGIYGACYKISILMSLFIQAFRYAAEPFFFAESKKDNARETYAKVMNYFILACSFILLVTMTNIDIVKFFVGEKFREGLHIVPVLLLANLFLGIFFNLSIWYKITGQTLYGAYLAIAGALITIGLNIWWVPLYGYTGAAWATLVCYAVMMGASYITGQKNYPINYRVGKGIGYIGLAMGLYLLGNYAENLVPGRTQAWFLHIFLLLIFVLVAYRIEKGSVSYSA